MLKPLLTTLILVISAEVFAVTYCSARKFHFPDPHQTTDVVERFVSSHNHASLFEPPALVENFTNPAPTEWRLVIRKDSAFSITDVYHSLSRQLVKNASSDTEEEAFLPAKLSGLEKFLKNVSVTGARELRLEFTKPIDEKELKAILSSPVGIVFKVDSLPLISRPDFIKGAGKNPAVAISPTQFQLGRGKDPAVTFKILDASNVTIKSAKAEGCKRLYYPNADIRREIKEKGGGTVIKASTTLLYVRIFPRLEKPFEERLRSALHPDRFPSLKNLEQTNRIFGVTTHGSSEIGPLKEAPMLPDTFISCDHVSIAPEILIKVEEDLAKNLKLATGVEINWDKIGCSRITLIKPSIDRMGVLSAFEFRSREELDRALNCERVSDNIFNVCPTGKPEERESHILRSGQVYPLALIPNEFVEFF